MAACEEVDLKEEAACKSRPPILDKRHVDFRGRRGVGFSRLAAHTSKLPDITELSLAGPEFDPPCLAAKEHSRSQLATLEQSMGTPEAADRRVATSRHAQSRLPKLLGLVLLPWDDQPLVLGVAILVMVASIVAPAWNEQATPITS